MKIKKTFLKLTKQTYPHGTEYELYDRLFDRVPELQKDDFGNLFIQIGDSDVMFTSHLDTATSAYTKVNHVIDGNIIKTDGKSILGADDKAGVTVMLYMIKNEVPGLYYFFLGEEVGCLGSRDLAAKHKVEKIPYINKVVSFDRRGTDSVITYQSATRCCSDAFADALCEEFNKAENSFSYRKDTGGVYTDSAVFTKIYPECTNISVGYYSEHTMSERQDIHHLKLLADACCKVDWNSLPSERDPEKVEYSYGGYGGGYYGWGYDYDDDYSYSRRVNHNTTSRNSDYYKTKTEKTKKKYPYYDNEYNFIGSYTLDNEGEYVEVDLSPKRIKAEFDLISKFLTDLNVMYETIKWDGVKMKLYHGNGAAAEEITRNEIVEYLGELDLVALAGDEKLSRIYGYNE